MIKQQPIIFLIAFVAIMMQANSQTPFYDAIKLSEHIDSKDKIISTTETYTILANYVNVDNPDNTYIDSQFNSISKNPFIVTAGGPRTKNNFSNDNLGVGTKSGLNVTNIADGTAKFLVQRAKQELSITFFDRFYKVLDSKKGADFRSLFPKTYASLKTVNKEIYQYSNYLNMLKEAFEKDLQNMVASLEPFLRDKKAALYLIDPDDPTARKIEYFESALLLVNNLRQGVHPAEAIGKLQNQVYHSKNTVLGNIQQAVKLLTIFSSSLKSTDTERYWVDSKAIASLLDIKTFKIYLGLLYQLHKDDMVFGQSFGSYLRAVATKTDELQKYQEFVQQLVVNSDQITLAIQGIKEEKESSGKVDSYKDLFQATLSFMKQLDNLKNIDPKFATRGYGDVLSVLDALNEVYLDINEGKYNALILDVSNLLTLLLSENRFTWNEELIKYGSFVANVAQAENGDQVEAAIEAIALPVGSATIKKRSKRNIALNAYVGLSPGLEYNGDTEEFGVSFGVNAPIGITLSKGLYEKEGTDKYIEKGASTWFFSLIDIGALTSFRFADTETKELPQIKLENIFAPGAYYVHGFANMPLSLGVGGQFGPQLRGLTEDSAELGSNLSFTVKLFLAVDIPLLNFHTKSR